MKHRVYKTSTVCGTDIYKVVVTNVYVGPTFLRLMQDWRKPSPHPRKRRTYALKKPPLQLSGTDATQATGRQDANGSRLLERFNLFSMAFNDAIRQLMPLQTVVW